MNAMDIPDLPDWVGLTDNHKPLLQHAFSVIQPRISEMTFSYLWGWRPYIKTALSRSEDTLLISFHNTRKNEMIALPPVTRDRDRAVGLIRRVLEGDQIDAFARVPAALAGYVVESANFETEEERERADYVHLASVLCDLPGPIFHSKRNHIRQFQQSQPNARYSAVEKDVARKCIDFSTRWLEDHPKKKLPGLQREVEITVRMLRNLEWLGLTGGALLDEEGAVLAFALGERLNQDTYVVRVEKADAAVPGSYQAINQQFVSHAASGYKWINREQDLGVPGLRKAKKSYHPHHLIRKYRVG